MAHPLLFCHGLESAPIGRKSQRLIDLGYEVTAPDGRGKDLAQRIDGILAALRPADPPPVVVGSSFGGIAGLVATIMAAREGLVIPGLVLCAPALTREPPAGTVDTLAPPCPTIVVHGTGDDVIPIDVSRTFAAAHPDRVRLVEVDDDHGLGAAGLAAIEAAVRELAGPSPLSPPS
jgi:pimeloyl-ACP methyl ester carboxylesterase